MAVPVKIKDLMDFEVEVFKKIGIPEADARITADVLTSADRRGIGSHGAARLGRYIGYVEKGLLNPNPDIKVVKETDTTLVVDGDNALGQVVGHWTMKKVIEKAKKSNVCLATVRNSNHYGIAGYYTLMALEEGLVGISLTNAAVLVVPTFAKDSVMGTNPLSIGFPAAKERPWLLDMATSTVPRGKLEVYNRAGKQLPMSWATNASGSPTANPQEVLDNLAGRKGGGLLPLGGGEEETGGHKGYDLSVMVDILSGILSGGLYGPLVYSMQKEGKGAGVCHFFGAFRIDAFVPENEFKEHLDDYIHRLKGASKRPDAEKIFVAGEKEYDKQEKFSDHVELQDKVVENLKEIGQKFGIELEI
jgi:LDH2 family malate/lactate/ureidoglycolate dehydrogenase